MKSMSLGCVLLLVLAGVVQAGHEQQVSVRPAAGTEFVQSLGGESVSEVLLAVERALQVLPEDAPSSAWAAELSPLLPEAHISAVSAHAYYRSVWDDELQKFIIVCCSNNQLTVSFPPAFEGAPIAAVVVDVMTLDAGRFDLPANTRAELSVTMGHGEFLAQLESQAVQDACAVLEAQLRAGASLVELGDVAGELKGAAEEANVEVVMAGPHYVARWDKETQMWVIVCLNDVALTLMLPGEAEGAAPRNVEVVRRVTVAL